MIQISEIPALLEQLEDHIADDLEGQELDFTLVGMRQAETHYPR